MCDFLQIGDSLFVDLPRVRLDGGAKKFRQRWGYELANQPPVLLEEDEDEDEDHATDSVSLRETGPAVAVCVPSPAGELYTHAYTLSNASASGGSPSRLFDENQTKTVLPTLAKA